MTPQMDRRDTEGGLAATMDPTGSLFQGWADKLRLRAGESHVSAGPDQPASQAHVAPSHTPSQTSGGQKSGPALLPEAAPNLAPRAW